MPMSAAERCRKYREKLKVTNPERFEEMKKKNAERTKAKKRKIADMNEDEKKEIRNKWRNSKRMKKESREIESMAVVEERSRRRYRSQLARVNVKLRQQVNELSLKNQNLRKALIRSTKKIRELTEKLNNLKPKKEAASVAPSENNQEIIAQQRSDEFLSPLTKSNMFVETVLSDIVSEEAKQMVKQKLFQQQVLEESLKETYQDSKSFTERKILKKIVQSEPVKKYNMQEKITKCLGLKSGIRRYKTIKQKRLKTIKEISQFYERDDVSRMTAGKKECLTLKKNKKQKRFLLNTLPNLYKLYRNEGGTLSYSTFKRYRPFYVVSPNIGDRNTCACVKHANLAFKAESLKKLGLITTTDLNELLSTIVCDIKSKTCMYSECTKCSGRRLQINDTEECQEDVSWFMWTTQTHEFEKLGERKVTKKTVKEKITGSVATLINLMQDDLIKFKEHHFNIYHQYKEYKKAIEQIQDNEVIIHCDFSENYSCKMTEEVQAMHFFKQQITLHTGVAYIKNESPLSFCTISPSLKHDPEAIWGHLEPILNFIKQKSPSIDCVHFYSDGPTTQYRQKKNFFLFSERTKEAGFVQATWSFFEAAHGKGAADGVGGAIKRTLDKRVAYGYDVVDAKTAFAALTDTSIKTFYVPEHKIQAIKTPETIKVIPSTMKIHQIIATDNKNLIKYRPLSCFCSRGYCDCYNTKLHELKTTQHRETKSKKSNQEQKKTKTTNKKIYSSSDSEDTDTQVTYAESDADIDWIEVESCVSMDEGKESEEKTINETEKEVNKKHEKVKILSEIRITPDNYDHNILKKSRPLLLKPIRTNFNICTKKTDKKNNDIYSNPVPSTSRISTMTIPERQNQHQEEFSSNSDDCINQYIEEWVEKSKDYNEDFKKRKMQENTTKVRDDIEESKEREKLENTTEERDYIDEFKKREKQENTTEERDYIKEFKEREKQKDNPKRRSDIEESKEREKQENTTEERDYIEEFKEREKQEIATEERNYIEESKERENHNITVERDTEEQKNTTVLMEIDVNVKDDFNIDERRLLSNAPLVRKKEKQERTTKEREIGVKVDDDLNKDEYIERNTKELGKTKEGELDGELGDDAKEDVIVTALDENSEIFSLNDSVLVRYYQRNHWKYFIGFIQNIETKNNESFHTISFLKTIKKPVLKFKVPKRVDVDIVTRDSIVKKIKICLNSQTKEYYLGDPTDEIYYTD